MRWKLYFALVLAGIARTPAAHAVKLVSFFEQAGLERIAASKYRADFAKLANQYQKQTDLFLCGPTSAAIVLNALRYNTEKAPRIEIKEEFIKQMPILKKTGKPYEPRLRMYTPENFLNADVLAIKTLSKIYAEPLDGRADGPRDPGFQLEQFRLALEKHKLKVKKIVVGTKATSRNKGHGKLPADTGDKVLAEIIKNLERADDYVLVNFHRPQFGQEGGGHISPLAAYDRDTDSFLLLDVNPSGAPWVWVDSDTLLNGMNTFDEEENRGVLLISEG